MKTITLLNGKGGVGKTTLAYNIADCIYRYSPRYEGKVVMIDADPQGTLAGWHDLAHTPMIEVLKADTRNSLLSAHRLAKQSGHEICIIDTAGRMHETLGTALSLTDLAIIPLKPSPLDVWATIDIIDLVKARMLINNKLKAIYVINQAIVGSSLTLDVCCALAECEATDIDLVKSVINGRIVYARTASSGLTVFDSKDQQAKDEIQSLTTEILSRLL